MFRLVVVLLVAGLGVACGDPGIEADRANRWTERDPAALAELDRARVERAKQAAADLGGRLMKRLGRSIAADGHAGAIGVCRDAAPTIAAEVSADRHVRIGRTSHRLRNPANAPPPWAQEAVVSLSDEADMAGPRVFAAPDGRLGVLLPIRLAAICEDCHGDSIDAAVAERLAEAYPEDRARGFSAGDLRGAFWVEVGK